MAAQVILKKGRAKPFFFRHPWVFSGAVESVKGEPDDGAIVEVRDSDHKFIARGFFNSKSQITVRLLLFEDAGRIDREFFAKRIKSAATFRRETLRIGEHTNAWRAAHSEADGLSGLVVDKYGDYLAVQFHSTGMETRREMILDILCEEFAPRGICDRSDDYQRSLDGMKPSAGVIRGDAPADLKINEHGIEYRVDLLGGQKTGFYLDQRDNRMRLRHLSAGRRVLDLFTYTGAAALNAVKGGAVEALAFDSSEPAIGLALRNAEGNACGNVRFEEKDAWDALAELADAGKKFDVIFMDPPSYAPGEGHVESAARAYKSLLMRSMKAVSNGGVLVTCSCSARFGAGEILEVLKSASLEAGRTALVFDITGQAQDHPVSVFCAEGAYLTAVWASISE
jgi:23S rRNA (cytosine1962-C5)-methyltransferase